MPSQHPESLPHSARTRELDQCRGQPALMPAPSPVHTTSPVHGRVSPRSFSAGSRAPNPLRKAHPVFSPRPALERSANDLQMSHSVPQAEKPGSCPPTAAAQRTQSKALTPHSARPPHTPKKSPFAVSGHFQISQSVQTGKNTKRTQRLQLAQTKQLTATSQPVQPLNSLNK